jgi:hypothetical protein
MQHIVEQMPDASLVLDFAMVNPPFYDLDEFSAIQKETYHGRRRHAQNSRNDANRRRYQDDDSMVMRPPREAMTKFEACYPGGEVGFVLDMIIDGLHLYLERHSTTGNTTPATARLAPPFWTSTMCGKKS